MIISHICCLHTGAYTQIQYLDISTGIFAYRMQNAFPSLRCRTWPFASCILPFLQCFLKLPCKDPAGGRYQEMLGDTGWILGREGGQCVLAPLAGCILCSAVQAACQGSCYCQALWMSTDLKYVCLFIYLLLLLLSVHQLLKYTLLLPQPVATSGIKTEYFRFFSWVFLSWK